MLDIFKGSGNLLYFYSFINTVSKVLKCKNPLITPQAEFLWQMFRLKRNPLHNIFYKFFGHWLEFEFPYNFEVSFKVFINIWSAFKVITWQMRLYANLSRKAFELFLISRLSNNPSLQLFNLTTKFLCLLNFITSYYICLLCFFNSFVPNAPFL